MTAEQDILADIQAAYAVRQGDSQAAARRAGFAGFADLVGADPSVPLTGRYGRSIGSMVSTGPTGTMAVAMRLVLDRETGIVGIEEAIVASTGPDADACEAGIAQAVAAVFGWAGALPAREQLVQGITGGDASRPSVLDMPPLRWSESVLPAPAPVSDASATGFAARVAGSALLDGFAALGFARPVLPVGPGAFLLTTDPA